MSEEPEALSLEEFSARYIKPAMTRLKQMVRDGEPLSPTHIALLDSIDPDWRTIYGINKWEQHLTFPTL